MTLHNHVRICRRRWASILLPTVFAVVVAAVFFIAQPTIYTATTTIYVSSGSGENLDELPQGSMVAGQRVQTYADLVTTPAVLDPVIEDLGLALPRAELAEDIVAQVPRDTLLLEITASAGEPQAATDLANATVASLQNLVNEIETPGGAPVAAGDELVELSVVREAELPARPHSPRPELIFGTGLGVGLLFGLILAYLREARDTSIRTPRDLKDLTAAPLIGVSRRAHRTPSEKDGTHPRPVDSVASFREMRIRLMSNNSPDSPSSYVITSSVEREGRTTVAVNLARSLVEGERRTLLIGADFGNPDIVDWFRAGAQSRGQVTDLTPAGLSEVLAGRAYLEDVIITDAEPGLDVLPAGRGQDHGLEASSMDAMAALLEGCAETYDVTIVDAPALLSRSAAALLAQITTGVIVVVRYGEVTRVQLGTGLDLLTRARARLVGVVLSGVPLRGPDSLRDLRAPGARRRRPDDGTGRADGETGQRLSARAAGLSSARRRRLPDGTLALSEGAPAPARIFRLPQDRT